MKFLAIFFISSLLLLCAQYACVDAAAIICGGDDSAAATTTATNSTATEAEAETEAAAKAENATTTTTTTTGVTVSSEVNKFFKSVQCTLEKAKPWVAEIEKEAKRLEETAKDFGKSVISRFADLMDKLISGDSIRTIIRTTTKQTTTTTTTPITTLPNDDDETHNSDSHVDRNERTETPTSSSSTTERIVLIAEPTGVQTAHDAEDNNALDNQIFSNDIDDVDDQPKQICPEGYVADANRLCQRV